MDKAAEKRANAIKRNIERYMPETTRAVAAAKASGSSLAIPQDAFAADYEKDACMLLGQVIKYAGMQGVDVWVMAKDSAPQP